MFNFYNTEKMVKAINVISFTFLCMYATVIMVKGYVYGY